MRELQSADLPQLRRILVATEAFTAVEVECAVELLEIVLKDPQQQDYQVIVAEHEGAVAGYVLYGAVPLTEGNYDLYWIATDPALHGKGAGRKLMEETEQRLRQAGARLLCLETSSQGSYVRTRRFYEQNGFIHVETVEHYEGWDGDPQAIYEKVLA